jgi:hypothetical protein
MKFKKIVGFGDSWMWGAEMVAPELQYIPGARGKSDFPENNAYREANCFLGQLGAHYNVPVENFGIGGGSLQSTIWTCLHWIENETLDLSDCLVLVALTETHRTSHYNNSHTVNPRDPSWARFAHSTWDKHRLDPSEFYNFLKQEFVLTASAAANNLNYQQAVYFFDGIATRNKIPLLQFHIFGDTHVRKVKNVPTLIWPGVDLYEEIVQGPNRNLRCGTHPSELGHKLIADRLILEIDTLNEI